nr:copia protein [Tanacetum cinerariifolium]
MIIKKDFEIVKEKVERKSLALNAKKESSDEEFLTSGSEDEEYAMVVREFKKFFKRRGKFVRQPRNDNKKIQRSRDDKNGKSDRTCFRCHDPNHLIGECPKPPKFMNQRGFVGGSWSDRGEEDDEKVKNEMCLVAQGLSEKIEESLNVTFDETPPPSKTSPLVDDDLDEEEAIREVEKKNLENVVEDETLKIDKIVNIKESRNHPLENVIGNLNQRTLRNKLDENGVVSRNKARLVAQGYNQQEGIDYDETYALVDRLECIRILLAYAYALDFKLFKMDVKSAFLNGFINEEVYVAQPLGFIDFKKPDHVYKLKKALYNLKQAPKSLAFYDYHNMIAILEKSEHNVDFHQIVDFVKASHIRYALTINPTVYVSHIRQFWSTARIETTNEGTKILATVDGKPRTISESSIRRNLKLNDEEGISSLPDVELFENLALMGYNILLNQKFTFQKGQFSHQWKFLIHTIMQGLSAKSTGFNEFSSNIATAVSKALSTAVDEPASPLGDDSQGEAFLTVSGLEAGQDRENIIKTSALPHDSTPRVTSLDVDEVSMQQQLHELTNLCTRLQRQQTEMATKIAAQDLEISNLKARIKLLKDKDKGTVELSRDDAPIKGRTLETWKEAGVERSTERGISAVGVPTGSGLVPTISAIFTTASVVTPSSRRKGKEKMVESDTPKKKKLQEQIDVQMAREMKEEMARDAQRMNEQIARDAEIARIHAEEELHMMIDGLDISNEMIVKHLHDYEQAAAELTIGKKIKLINELVKYQDHHAKILKYQAQQSKPLSKKQQREFYMSVLRSHSGWKIKHFKEEGERFKRKGLRLEHGSAKKMKTSEEVSEEDLKEMIQLVPVEALQVKHPIIDWEIHTEGKRDYWKIIRLERNTTVYQFFVDMLKQFDREHLNQLWMLVKETLSVRHASSDKEKELWVELKRLFEPDHEDQLWTHTQALMHDPLEWKLYDTCDVHYIFTRDQEIFMLVERDYPLRRGLAIVMISNKLQVESYSQMANDLTMKIHNIANSPR